MDPPAFLKHLLTLTANGMNVNQTLQLTQHIGGARLKNQLAFLNGLRPMLMQLPILLWKDMKSRQAALNNLLTLMAELTQQEQKQLLRGLPDESSHQLSEHDCPVGHAPVRAGRRILRHRHCLHDDHPLPTGLVDVLIAVNICISCLLIMLAMHLPRPLAFSTFPAVLLLTTMFRLALSISTTRLILLNQDAGHIVEAFGQFVVGGNLAVGLVIFLILTVVNFLVITKGSERVAEVGARFTLDAMPGKQMSIDSDLRANLITVQEARNRRAELNKESQLFGAMDGAMKFVNGDAIASLIIVAINMIGGISIGVLQHNMSAGDALQLYTVLTIGDGLIAQIPALLISVTCGMIITRVPNTEAGAEANIGREIAEQITSQPKAWIIAAVAMLGFAALPGMPTGVFITIAIICGAGACCSCNGQNPSPTNNAPLPSPRK